jgi:hypothetical protein
MCLSAACLSFPAVLGFNTSVLGCARGRRFSTLVGANNAEVDDSMRLGRGVRHGDDELEWILLQHVPI